MQIHSVCVWSNIYDNFNHLGLAKIRCNKDVQCIGIYDKTCDNSGPFQLCKHGFVTPAVSVSSCIHKKNEYKGDQ